MQTRKTLNMIQMAVAMCLLLATSATVYAQEEDELMMRRGAGTDEIMGTLRSFRRPENAAQPTTTALAVRVYFERNSAALTAETKAELSNYGKSLAAEEFKDARWAIEGHTDASGSADYNRALSEQRAKSVYNYLIEEFGMNPEQLVPQGKGESELFDPAAPTSGVNRRVRIKYLGG
jgi:outer membrane protein OmpA-like peptidoglycan-associated protein